MLSHINPSIRTNKRRPSRVWSNSIHNTTWMSDPRKAIIRLDRPITTCGAATANCNTGSPFGLEKAIHIVCDNNQAKWIHQMTTKFRETVQVDELANCSNNMVSQALGLFCGLFSLSLARNHAPRAITQITEPWHRIAQLLLPRNGLRPEEDRYHLALVVRSKSLARLVP